ncbi:unnamed protein product [Penicillium viridicatum]
MSSTHPLEFHAPGWHDEERTPVVDGKYCDRATGEIKLASDGDHQESMGPPAVDIIVRSQHIDTIKCTYRASRKLELDSVIATTYAIRVTLAHELTPDQFSEIALNMANGVWDQTD